MKRTPIPIRLIGALAILGSSSAVQAATVSLVAVAVNGEPITPTDFVTVSPGDVIECEIHITGWADDNWCPIDASTFQACSSNADCLDGCREFLLYAYQVGIDATGYISGETGVLQPIGWDRPFPTRNPCETDADCSKGTRCGRGICRYATCRGDDDCPEGMECILDHCFGPNYDPELGAYIDEGRSDFVFFGFGEIVITGVATSTPAYRYGALQFDSSRGVVDIGQSAYAGTLLLAASDVDDLHGEACGNFVLTFVHDVEETFLISPNVRFPTRPFVRYTQFAPRFAPLTINVPCEFGACIYPDRSCVEEVTRTTCTTAGGLWMAGRSCPDRFVPGDIKSRQGVPRDE